VLNESHQLLLHQNVSILLGGDSAVSEDGDAKSKVVPAGGIFGLAFEVVRVFDEFGDLVLDCLFDTLFHLLVCKYVVDGFMYLLIVVCLEGIASFSGKQFEPLHHLDSGKTMAIEDGLFLEPLQHELSYLCLAYYRAFLQH